MSARIHKIEPARLRAKNLLRATPLRPATAGITWETPGSHLEISSVRFVPFSNMFLERRTQVSGSKEMRHKVESTDPPLLRPSSYHSVSPARHAATLIHNPASKRICPAPANAPAPTSTGDISKGKPTRSITPDTIKTT